MKQNKNNYQHLVQRQRKWTLTTLWRRRCTARSRWPRRFGSSDTRRVCTSCTGWRKRSGCSWAPGTCRSCADCICRCRVWRLSSSRPAAPSSTFWPQQKTESFNDVWGQHKQTELCIFCCFSALAGEKGNKLPIRGQSLTARASPRPASAPRPAAAPPGSAPARTRTGSSGWCPLQPEAWCLEPRTFSVGYPRSAAASPSFVNKLNILQILTKATR